MRLYNLTNLSFTNVSKNFFFRGVQVGTANFVKPTVSLDIIDGLEEFLKSQGCKSVSEIIGAARV